MNVDGVVVRCVIMSVWLYMHFLFMLVSICCYACISMLIGLTYVDDYGYEIQV